VSGESQRLASAYELLDIIEKARTHGVVKEINLTSKLKECQEQYEQLKERANKLEMEITRLKVQNEQLHKALDLFGGRSSVTEE
jgi:cell shape-determining protein MreC